jgi:hypothetical protein
MKGLTPFLGVMAFYAVLSYIVGPLGFYYFVDKTLMSAGNGFVVGSIVSVLLWFTFRSTILSS